MFGSFLFKKAIFWPLFIVSGISASEGDRQPCFIHCVDHCIQEYIYPNERWSASKRSHLKVNFYEGLCPHSTVSSIKFHNEALFWWGENNCHYLCMKKVEAKAKGQRAPIKYYGKWPFRRILGIQEPASALFSFLNILPHLKFFAFHELPSSGKGRMFALAWETFAGISSVTWVFSTIFHCRDTKVTELLDYSLAACSVYSGFLCLLSTLRRNRAIKIVSRVVQYICLLHVLIMLTIGIYYALNLYILGIIESCSYALFLNAYIPRKHEVHVIKGIISHSLLFFGGLLFEVYLDFPPIWEILDAHALWHLVTVFAWILFYQFITVETLTKELLNT